jgi:hypothetical protein
MMSAAFDFDRIAVPFRMQPGLRRLADGEPQLTPLLAGSPLWHEKQAVLMAGASRLQQPGFDPAPALAAIARQAAMQGLPMASETTPLELAFEEDFAVLEGAGATLPWLCVCVPSHWAPEEKLGLPFAEVHGPVADNSALLAAARHLVELVTAGERWERFVWTITPSPRYDQHPRRHAREPWPNEGDPQAFAARCWLRAERQTFLPVGGVTGQAVFTIRVMLKPLVEAVDTPAKAQRLHGALASMSPAVLAYKNLTGARDPVLRWLAQRTG